VRTSERIRAEQDCPRCGAKAGDRCLTQDGWGSPRSNHPERNRAFTERKADEMRRVAFDEERANG
jgi:hypothetical protein